MIFPLGMATQRIVIAKLAGEAAEAAGTCFRRWLAARPAGDARVSSAGEWPSRYCSEMDRLVADLRKHADRLPAIFFCEYVDTWSMGCHFEFWLRPRPTKGPLHVASKRFDLYLYALPDRGALQNWLRRGLRLKRVRERNPQEQQWFVSNLLAAATSWEGMVRSSALIVVRECVGETVSDERLLESLKTAPAWLRGSCGGKA